MTLAAKLLRRSCGEEYDQSDSALLCLTGGILCPPQPMEGKAAFRSGGLLSV